MTIKKIEVTGMNQTSSHTAQVITFSLFYKFFCLKYFLITNFVTNFSVLAFICSFVLIIVLGFYVQF